MGHYEQPKQYKKVIIPRKNGKIYIPGPSLADRLKRAAQVLTISTLGAVPVVYLPTIINYDSKPSMQEYVEAGTTDAGYKSFAQDEEQTLQSADDAQEQAEDITAKLAQFPAPEDGTQLLVGSFANKERAHTLLEDLSKQYAVATEEFDNRGALLQRVYAKPEDIAEAVAHLRSHDNIKPSLIERKSGKNHYLNLEAALHEQEFEQYTGMPYFETVKQEIQRIKDERNIGDTGSFMNFAYSIMETESHYRPGLVSSAGAIGLMQVMPESAMLVDYSTEDLRRMRLRHPLRYHALKREYRKRLFDPETNIRYGIELLAEAHDYWSQQYKDETRVKELAAAEYNSGRNNTIKRYLFTPWNKRIKETREYTRKVLRANEEYQQDPVDRYRRVAAR